MPYIQNNIPPPNRVSDFSLHNFVGGLNNRSSVLEENQCSDVLNMAFENAEIMQKRKGTTYFDQLKLTDEIIFLDEFKPYKETDILIRATKTEMYVGNTKVKDLKGKLSGTNFSGKYFFADGSGLYVYGKFPKEAGTYTKIIGTASEDYVLMEVVTPPVYVALPEEHVEGVSAYDYTNRKVWYEPCMNEVKDTFKQGNVIPEGPRFVINHDGRLFVSGADKDNDNVFISDVNRPYYFPASLPMQVPPNSDRVSGLAVYNNAVIIGRKNDIHAIHGTTNRTDLGLSVFRLERLNTHTGFANHNSIDLGHNYLFFMGADGNAYILTNVQGREDIVATQLLTRNLDFFNEPVNLTKSDIYESSSIFYQDSWYLSMKDKVMVYSYMHRAWTMYDNLHARSFYDFHDVMIWGNKDGGISMISEDYLDYGKPYRAHWTSKRFDMGDPTTFKHFREFYLVAHTFPELPSNIYVKFEIDYIDIKSSAVIKNQIAVWGRSRFGDRFITRTINASIPFIIGRRGRNMQFTISNGFFQQGEVELESQIDKYQAPKFEQMVYAKDTGNYFLYEDGEWKLLTTEDFNQPMRVYQLNGEYELRRKR